MYSTISDMIFSLLKQYRQQLLQITLQNVLKVLTFLKKNSQKVFDSKFPNESRYCIYSKFFYVQS